MSAMIFQIQSFLIVCVLTFGILKRKNRSLHIKTMLTGIIWDVILILQIELTRGAIKKASKAVSNPMILNIHVALALTTVLLFFFLIFSGTKLKNGNESIRGKHKLAGMTAYILRIAVFATSFWAVTE